ncbi:MAG: FAD-binding oxidoreductase [Pseudomonadota bacterium]
MRRLRGPGKTYRRGDPGFDAAILETSFSGRDPGVRPDVLRQPNTVAEAVAAVEEACREGQNISVCSGGHSWSQNHLRDGGMLIDMARINGIEVDKERRIARVGPGCWCIHLDRRLAKDGLFFPVGHAPDIGMGGFLLQGGFGWNSRRLGLGCENVLGVDVVLADGREIHASATENADLFWAARGAGPGFFALVTRYHLRVHPRPKAMGMKMQIFRERHLEDLFRWADEIGGDVADTVEFQMVITPRVLGLGVPGVEVLAPVLAPSWAEARKAVSFLNGPMRRKASITTPLIPISTTWMSTIVSKTHFPPKMRWCVDNMWTDAPMEDLLPGLRRISETMPAAPSHALWLNWRPKGGRPDMAFSREASQYLAVYGEWRRAEDDARYANWATERMREMEPLSRGVQLADENLARRPAWFVEPAALERLDAIRAKYDPQGRFRSWAGRPDALKERPAPAPSAAREATGPAPVA